MWVEKPYLCNLTVNTHCSKQRALIVVIQGVKQRINLTKVSYVTKNSVKWIIWKYNVKRLKTAVSILLRLFMRDNVALSASLENSSNRSLHLQKLAIILEFRI